MDDTLATLRAAHLQMIQGVIGRMSANSAALKGFCVTSTAAIFVLQRDDLGPRALWLLVFVALFALCDAGYLRLERDFRHFYDRTAARPLSEAEDMAIVRPRVLAIDYAGALKSWSVGGFYSCVAVAVFVVGAMANQ